MAEIRLPTRGIADRTAIRKTPPPVCPPSGMENVVARRPGSGREQITKRPGMVDLFDQAFGPGPIQGLGTVSHASAVTSFIFGASREIDETNGISRRSMRYDANAFTMPMSITAARGTRDTLKVYGSGGACRVQRGGAASADFAVIPGVSGFPNSPVPSMVAIHPSGTLAAVLVNYTDTTIKTLIAFWNPVTGAFVGAKHLSGGTNIASSALVWTQRALWIAKGANLHYILTPLVSGQVTLENLASTSVNQAPGSPNGALSAASRITGLCSYTDAAGDVWLYACFEGATAAGTHANPTGLVTTGGCAKHFRAGIYRLGEIVQPSGALDFSIVQFGPEAADVDPYVEVSGSSAILHRTVRFSQVLDRAPRGCLPIRIDCNSVGEVAVVFTNQGYGPTVALPPDGVSRAYSTTAKFTAAGLLVWDKDTNSLIPGEAGGKLTGIATTYPTDIPDEDGGNAGTTSKNGPALRYVRIDAFGDVYVSGRLGSGPAMVYGFQAGSGLPKWPRNLADPAQAAGASGWVSGGLALVEGQVLVLSKRTNLWDPDSGSEPWASMWLLDPIDGVNLWTYSLTQQAAGAAPNDDPSGTALAATDAVAVWSAALFTDA